MVSVVKYFRRNHFQKNNFLENLFRRLVRTKKLQKEKMQLSSESSNVQLPLSDSVEQVWPDSAKIAEFRPDSSESGRIPAILARSDRISGRINGRIQSDQAGFWPWPEFGPPAFRDDGRMSPDSGVCSFPVAGCC
jgi:hypothetical protein